MNKINTFFFGLLFTIFWVSGELIAQTVNLPAGNYSNVAPWVSGKVPRINWQAPAGTVISGTPASPTTSICGSPFNSTLDYTFDHYRLSSSLGSSSDPCWGASCNSSANTWYMGGWISSAENYYTISNFGSLLQSALNPPNTYTLTRLTLRYRQDCDDRFHLINPSQGSVNYTVVVRPWITVNSGNPIYICEGDVVDLAPLTNYSDIRLNILGVDQGNAVFNAGIYTAGSYSVGFWRNFDQGRGTETQTVVVIKNTTPATASATATVCTGSNIMLSATGAVAGENYRWYDAPTGGTLVGTGNNISITASLPAGLKTYYVAKYNESLACAESARRATNGVQVNTIPVINNHPASGNVCINSTLSLTVNNTGTPTPTYQWRFFGADISGATSATYNLPNFQASNAGQYSVIITNSCGSITSNIAVITAVDVATITNQPEDRTACVGTNTTIVGTSTIGTVSSYQWQKFISGAWTNISNGTKYSGVTTAVLGVNNLTVGDAGDFRVVVTGPCNSANSSDATLTVNATSITTQPPNSGVCLGGTIQVPVVAGGTGPFGYQWQKKSGALYNNVSGQTSDKLTIIGAVAGDGGIYRVVVTGSCGSVNSTDMTLTINAIPIAPTAADVARCSDGSITATASSGSPSPVFKWYANPSDVVPVFTGASYNIANLTVSTTYYVSTTSLGCEGPKKAVNFTRYDSRPVNVGPALTLCIAQGPYDLEADIADAIAVGSNFTWTAGAASFNTKIFDPAVVGEGTYIVSYDPPAVAKATPHCLTATTRTVSVITGAGAGGITFDPGVVSGGNNLNLCVGDDPVVLNSIPSAAGGSWSQISGQGLSFNASNAIFTPNSSSFTPSAPNVVRYTVTVGGCTAAIDLNVFVKDNQNTPVVSGIPNTICPGSSLTLLASVAAPGTWNYVWTKPGVTGSLSNAASYSFVVSGTETIEVRSINTFGCRSTAALASISTPFSSGSISPSKALINTGESVKFIYDVTAQGNTYKWEFGDGFTSSQQNPTHFYFTPGIYTIFLTITSNLGCSQVVEYNSVTVEGNPIEIITGINADEPSLEGEAKKQLVVRGYPNPASEQLTIESSLPVNAVIINSMIGIPVKSSSFDFPENTVVLDINDLPQGVYLVNVRAGVNTSTMKIIKK